MLGTDFLRAMDVVGRTITLMLTSGHSVAGRMDRWYVNTNAVGEGTGYVFVIHNDQENTETHVHAEHIMGFTIPMAR